VRYIKNKKHINPRYFLIEQVDMTAITKPEDAITTINSITTGYEETIGTEGDAYNQDILDALTEWKENPPDFDTIKEKLQEWIKQWQPRDDDGKWYLGQVQAISGAIG
jgi:hypothetical protein